MFILNILNILNGYSKILNFSVIKCGSFGSFVFFWFCETEYALLFVSTHIHFLYPLFISLKYPLFK